jgi:hypothetical protein
LSWTSPPYGKRKLTARATDNQGGISQSPPLGITITSQPPVLALQSPAEGAVIEAGSSVWISASASDADGTVVSVDCYANGSLIATLPAAPWTLNWLPAISGPVTLTAIARDDSGAESPAATRTLSVQAALVNPVLIPAGARLGGFWTMGWIKARRGWPPLLTTAPGRLRPRSSDSTITTTAASPRW